MGWPHRLGLVAGLLAGCTDHEGLWQVERVEIDGVAVEDAGFLDIQGSSGASVGPVAWLLRYTWDPEARSFVPDPTPDVQPASFSEQGWEDGEPGTLTLQIATPDGGEIPSTLQVPKPENRAMILEDPDFPSGPMIWELGR